jgi:hypothetical protein
MTLRLYPYMTTGLPFSVDFWPSIRYVEHKGFESEAFQMPELQLPMRCRLQGAMNIMKRATGYMSVAGHLDGSPELGRIKP